MTLEQCFINGRVVGLFWLERPEFVVLAEVPDGEPMPPTSVPAAQAVALFDRVVPGPGGVRRRAVLFFPTVTANLSGGTAAYASYAFNKGLWNFCFYWRDAVTASSPEKFPSGNPVSLSAAQWQIKLDCNNGTWPKSLDDLSIGWNEAGRCLECSGVGGVWKVQTREQAIHTSKVIDIELAPGSESAAGGLRFPFGDTHEAFAAMPLEFALHKVSQDDLVVTVDRVMQARAVDAMLDDGSCDLVLDPRDTSSTLATIATPRSRLEFRAGTRLFSTFRSDQGVRVILQPADSPDRGFARLRPVLTIGSVRGPGVWQPDDPSDASFVLEGRFVVVGVEGDPDEGTATGEDELRVMVGRSATECVHLRRGDEFNFVPDRPAVVEGVVPGAGAAALTPGGDGGGMHDAGQFLKTSWLTVRRAKPPAGAAVADGAASDGPTFRSEPSNAPLFRPATSGQGVVPATAAAMAAVAAPLERKHVPYGTFNEDVSIPVFPWGGWNLSDPAANAVHFETTRLAPERRARMPRQSGPAAAGAAKVPRAAKALGAAKALSAGALAVTPQGLVAEVIGGDYRTLYFGVAGVPVRPEGASVPPAIEVRLEIVPNAAGRAVYDEVQKALRAEDLFFVINEPKVEAKGVLKLIAAVGDPPTQGGTQAVREHTCAVADFSGDLDINALGDTVVFIKYFRGKSLKTLVADAKFWNCRTSLAGSITAEQIEALAKLNDTSADKTLSKAWKDVWENEDWQGVVALNVPLNGQPALFEALGAGMKDTTTFKFHHLGFDFLPVKAKDILGGAPTRTGSVFALLLYDKTDDDPGRMTPDAADADPCGDAYTPTYEFTVKHVDVLVRRSQIIRFAAEAKLGFSHFFWDQSADGKPTEIKLLGSYEARPKDGGGTANLFKLVSQGEAALNFSADSFLQKLTVRDATLSVTSAAGDAAGREIKFFVGLGAELTFNPDKEPLFKDLFTFKSVSLEHGGFEVTYRPDASGADRTRCRFKADGLRAAVTVADSDGLLSLLPVKFINLRIAFDKLLDFGDLKFMPVIPPKVPGFHFGIEFDLDFGFLGKLAGSGVSMKFPMLLGWRRGGVLGGFGLGIQFPDWDGESFQIGIQQFVALRAKKMELKRCDKQNSAVLVASEAQLVVFGKAWPAPPTTFGLAVYTTLKGGPKFGWLIGLKKEDGVLRFIGAGHRVATPQGKDAKEIVEKCYGLLELTPDTDVCTLPAPADGEDGWLVAAEFEKENLFQAWLALADGGAGGKPVYALQLDLVGLIDVAASYRRVNDRLGAFSAEVNLAADLPPMQFGAGRVRLPRIRTEVFTDGGWLVDFGYPWNHDFRSSFQLEVAIFVGSGGVYLGYTSAAAADLLQIDASNRYGYGPADANDPNFSDLNAVRAGLALRVGLGRSLDLGVLKGEASITLYGSLEGAMAFAKGQHQPVLYAIKGTAGIMVQIWAELDFVVLQARAEICAYAEFGFELRRVVGTKAVNKTDEHGVTQKVVENYAITLPFTVFAEVGIYVHFEVWVTIGCVRVKLFDLTFSASWRIEETFGDVSDVRLADAVKPGVLPAAGLKPARALAATPAWQWPAAPGGGALAMYVAVVPAAADPADAGRTDPGKYDPSLVCHLMVRVGDGFLSLSKFMAAWALGLDPTGNPQVDRVVVTDRTTALKPDDAWSGAQGQRVLDALRSQFAVSLATVPGDDDPNALKPGETAGGPRYVPLPGWPGVRIGLQHNGQLLDEPPTPAVPASAQALGPGATWADHAVVDFVRLLTRSVLAEVDRTLRPVADGKMSWDDLWAALAPEPPAPPKPD